MRDHLKRNFGCRKSVVTKDETKRWKHRRHWIKKEMSHVTKKCWHVTDSRWQKYANTQFVLWKFTVHLLWVQFAIYELEEITITNEIVLCQVMLFLRSRVPKTIKFIKPRTTMTKPMKRRKVKFVEMREMQRKLWQQTSIVMMDRQVELNLNWIESNLCKCKVMWFSGIFLSFGMRWNRSFIIRILVGGGVSQK